MPAPVACDYPSLGNPDLCVRKCVTTLWRIVSGIRKVTTTMLDVVGRGLLRIGYESELRTG